MKIYWKVGASLLGAALLSIFFADRAITEFAIHMKSTPALFISSLGYIFGQLHFPLIAFIILGTLFSIGKRSDLAYRLIIATHAMFISGIFVQIPKYVFGRKRPYAGYDNLSWFNNYELFGGKNFSYKFMSMPSGDTITVAAFAIVLALMCKNKIVRVIFLLMPVVTMFTRVHISKHWFSDTLIGLTLGLLIGKSVLDSYRKEGIVDNR